MTLASTVREKLNDWRPAAGRQELIVTADQGSLILTADRREELGCLVWELAVRRQAPASDTLRAWAERIAGRVTGLLEPLKIVEIDAERNEGVLRSDKPSSRDEQVFYYEIFLRGTSAATLRRYQAPVHNGRRDQIAFALTHDAIAKLAGDLAG
jgi:hypothetical protein